MGPFIRIGLRYGVGGIIGYEVGARLASDPDIVAVITVASTASIGIATEGAYYLAKRFGWKT